MSKQQFQIGFAAVALLVALRLGLGCHFLYEGVWKIRHHDEFTAEPFLTQAKGPLSGIFYAMLDDIDGRRRLQKDLTVVAGKTVATVKDQRLRDVGTASARSSSAAVVPAATIWRRRRRSFSRSTANRSSGGLPRSSRTSKPILPRWIALRRPPPTRPTRRSSGSTAGRRCRSCGPKRRFGWPNWTPAKTPTNTPCWPWFPRRIGRKVSGRGVESALLEPHRPDQLRRDLRPCGDWAVPDARLLHAAGGLGRSGLHVLRRRRPSRPGRESIRPTRRWWATPC